ncbi:MAG: KH domain-containing protein [Oscillospiraceae bacterium]|nr:KH domain-containing protein [Oscillospiraceae bacterium]
MKELVVYIAKELVSKPDSVVVTQEETEGEFKLKLSVAPEDMGKIIGRGGRTARDIRTALRAAAGFKGKLVSLEIVEDAKVS